MLTSKGLCRKVVKSGLLLGIGGSVNSLIKVGSLVFSTNRQSAFFNPTQYRRYAELSAGNCNKIKMWYHKRINPSKVIHIKCFIT